MKRSIVMRAGIGAALLLLFVVSGFTDDASVTEELKLYMGELSVIPVSNPSRVVIGNPAVVDVVQATKKEIVLTPKAVGKTTLTVWDNYGEQSYRISVYAENIIEIKNRIDRLIARAKVPNVYTQAEEEEGKVMILGTVGNAQDTERINLALGELKNKTVDLTVKKDDDTSIEIDAQVLELNKGAQDTLGFTWPGSISFTEVGSPGISAAGTSWYKVFHVANVTRGAANPFTLQFDALVQEGKARILSRPRLACQSGREAKLVVGGEVPILTATVTSTGTAGNVEYKEYGIILEIKPVVTEGDKIHLKVNIEVSEVQTSDTTFSTDYAKAYPITKRTATTELFLEDGQTMAIGGLIKQKSEEALRKVPWLADVPVLGMFFRKKTTTEGGGQTARSDTELFIALTPRIANKAKLKAQAKEIVPAAAPEYVEESGLTPQEKYTRIIQRRIVDTLTYPVAARQAGFKGTVILALNLSYLGKPQEIKVKTTSGYKILDNNALAAARRITSYPPFPPSLEAKDIWVDIPIIYQLD